MAKLTTKEKLLAFFEQSKGIYFSGEELAGQLGVSRTAIWKAVNSLREQGYQIDGTARKGYCLSAETDILSAQGIEKYLQDAGKFENSAANGATDYKSKFSLTVLSQTESTNSLLRAMAAEGAPEGTAVIAASQTGGRGRVGRSFYSPAETGIYMSLLLRPANCPAKRAESITTMAAVAVCEAIGAVCGKEAKIKWINDIFMNGKKVCGILTEAAFNLENGFLDYAVLGIGINAYAPEGGFPEDIARIAGAVFDDRISDGKNRLAAEVLMRFMNYYEGDDFNAHVKKYQELCFVVGKKVKVITPISERKAVAIAVDDECHLVVEYQDGSRETLSSGEISVKPEM